MGLLLLRMQLLLLLLDFKLVVMKLLIRMVQLLLLLLDLELIGMKLGGVLCPLLRLGRFFCF